MKYGKNFRIGKTVDETGKRENGSRAAGEHETGVLVAWSENGAIS
jgi:hypothetical protein